MEKVKVFAPASVANVGPGYDTFGFAIEHLGDVITLWKRGDNKLNILPAEGATLPTDPAKNVATVAIRSLLDHLDSEQGFDVQIRKLFQPGSGLGSSASSAAGAVFAANELLGKPLKVEKLLPHALAGEQLASGAIHADNVAPALLGGFRAVRSYDPLDMFTVKMPEKLRVLIIFPNVEVKTSVAKGLVPKEITVKDAREQWGNVAALIHALHTEDYALLSRAITDRIAEPVRKGLIPEYGNVKQAAREFGSVGFNISGSGPSMFSLFTSAEAAKACMAKIEKIYQKVQLPVMMHLSRINPNGCEVIQ